MVEEFGVCLDWATFSAPSEHDEAAHFHAFATDYMRREKERWQHTAEKRIGAYVGIQVGDTSHVRRPYDGHEMIVATGYESNRLAEEVIIHGVNAKPTRIDVRATARATKAQPRYPEGVRAVILRLRAEKGKELNKKMALFDGGCGNTGLTVGSRTSESYGRIYDHEAKHGARATALIWAHEVEFKGDTAKGFFNAYREADERPKYLAGVMRRRLEAWGVPCAWLAEHDKISIMRGSQQTTDEGRLAYLDKVVFPLIVKLMENGHSDEIKALIKKHGLEDLF